jgi:hypothetical protein
MLRSRVFGALLLSACALVCAAPADTATIIFHDGAKVHGDVTETPAEIVLDTPYGTRRFARDRVLRIEYDAQESPQRANPPVPATRSATTGPARDKNDGEASSRPTRNVYRGPAPPPPLSEHDITRLKLAEYPLDGEPQTVHVEFTKKRNEPSVETLVEKAIADSKSDEPDWKRILEKGHPPEKLQLVLRTTGLRYADRINVRGDTETFSEFRKKVLPLAMRGCGRTGCHGGNTTEHFRFPTGAQSSDDFVYTAFYVLDSIRTPLGPMIDRDLPEESALLKYMLPHKEGTKPPHSMVKNGKVIPVFESRDSREYRDVVSWISSLRVPHPDYQLAYQAPDWLAKLAEPRSVPQPADPETQPAKAESKPASRPDRKP